LSILPNIHAEKIEMWIYALSLGTMNPKHAAAYLGSLAILASAFLPWATFTMPMGTLTVTGIEGNEGYLAMAIGLGGLVLTYFNSRYTILAGVLALVLAAVEIVDMANSMESREMMESKGITAGIGEGIYVLAAGGLVLAISGWMLSRNN
jgi:hypothetical protein